MKLRKTILVICVMLFASMLYAQEVDEVARPVGGLEAIINNVQYPATAKEEGIQGKVFVKAVIDTDGNVISTEVYKGVSELNDAAIAAVKATKFTPAKAKGKTVQAEVTIPIFFKLNDCDKKKS